MKGEETIVLLNDCLLLRKREVLRKYIQFITSALFANMSSSVVTEKTPSTVEQTVRNLFSVSSSRLLSVKRMDALPLIAAEECSGPDAKQSN